MKNIDTEPQLHFPPTDAEIISALNWQSTRNTRETALKYFLKYYYNYRQYTAEQLDNITKNFSYIPMTMIWLMRIFRDNPECLKTLYADKLNKFFSIVDVYTTSSTVTEHPVRTIKKPIDYLENAKEYIDHWIDNIIINKTFIAIPEHFVWTYRLSKQNCSDIARYIQKYIIDIPEYSKQLQNTVDYFINIPKSWVDIDNEKQIVRKKQPKTRKQKIKSAYKQVQKLNYLKSFNNINSIVPDTIPGKTLLVTYNTVTKQLLLYQAEVINSLSVKGSTMYNCSTIAKRLRKPDITLPEILSAGNRTEVKTIFKKLTTKESSVSNRINDNMLLLRVF